MNILLTFDYELYFGVFTGTQHKCLIRPTDELIKIAEKHNVRFTFFVDCGYLVRLAEYKQRYKNLEDDYKVIVAQLKYLAAKGHDVQLHIHPHWQDTIYDGKQWVMNTTRYRFHQFDKMETDEIFSTYAETLKSITGQKLHTFRAGGWCIQPFDVFKPYLVAEGIKIDSTVYDGGFTDLSPYYYDFRNLPKKAWWKFEDDPAIENDNGTFMELAISSMRVSPLFYWRLYLLGRLNPKRHKPIGDGKPILTSGYKKRILSRYTTQAVSVDGYNARLLQKETNRHQRAHTELMVILGHPKALSPYSLETIDRYLGHNKTNHQVITYADFLKQKSSYEKS